MPASHLGVQIGPTADKAPHPLPAANPARYVDPSPVRAISDWVATMMPLLGMSSTAAAFSQDPFGAFAMQMAFIRRAQMSTASAKRFWLMRATI